MPLGELTAAELIKALHIYLQYAYPDGQVPGKRRHYQAVHEGQTLKELFHLQGVEPVPGQLPSEPVGYSFRIGNARYQHMKLKVLPWKEPPGFVFSVDTHDNFRIPPNAPDAEQFRELQQQNQELARCIESAWEESGLPTSSGLLRRHLSRAQASARSQSRSPAEDQ